MKGSPCCLHFKIAPFVHFLYRSSAAKVSVEKRLLHSNNTGTGARRAQIQAARKAGVHPNS